MTQRFCHPVAFHTVLYRNPWLSIFGATEAAIFPQKLKRLLHARASINPSTFSGGPYLEHGKQSIKASLEHRMMLHRGKTQVTYCTLQLLKWVAFQIMGCIWNLTAQHHTSFNIQISGSQPGVLKTHETIGLRVKYTRGVLSAEQTSVGGTVTEKCWEPLTDHTVL